MKIWNYFLTLVPGDLLMEVETKYRDNIHISLNTVTGHTYLGICLYHKLSWSPHVDCIMNKANCLLDFLKRNVQNASTQIKEYVYKQLLMPSIEYCSAIWNPYHHSDIYTVEMIQHYAAHFVLNKPWHRQQQNDSITVMLANLKWPSLENRRKFLVLFYSSKS